MRTILVPITVIITNETEDKLREVMRCATSSNCGKKEKLDIGIIGNQIWTGTKKAHTVLAILQNNGISYNYAAKHFSSSKAIRTGMKEVAGKTNKSLSKETKRERIKRIKGLIAAHS